MEAYDELAQASSRLNFAIDCVDSEKAPVETVERVIELVDRARVILESVKP